MPDFTFDPIKYNPGSDGNVGSGDVPGPYGDPRPTDVNAGDHSGKVLAGGPLGMVHYQSVTDVLASEGSPLANAGTPGIVNQVTAEGRFTDADATGIYILGHGVKYASGGAAASPGMVFPISAAAIGVSQVMKVGAVLTTNGIAIPDTASIDIGFYPVVSGGGAGSMVYTLTTTGQIVENYGDGVAADTIYGRDNPDRRADFVSGGDENYAMGVNLGVALPTGCLLDVEMALSVTPY